MRCRGWARPRVGLARRAGDVSNAEGPSGVGAREAAQDEAGSLRSCAGCASIGI
jgi:hypothetical protein